MSTKAFTQVEGTPSRQVVVSASLAALDPLAPPLAIPDSETLRERLSEQLGMPVVVTLENQDANLGCVEDVFGGSQGSRKRGRTSTPLQLPPPLPSRRPPA